MSRLCLTCRLSSVINVNASGFIFAAQHRTLHSQVKKYDSKAAVAGTPKAYSTGEDMVEVKV